MTHSEFRNKLANIVGNLDCETKDAFHDWNTGLELLLFQDSNNVTWTETMYNNTPQEAMLIANQSPNAHCWWIRLTGEIIDLSSDNVIATIAPSYAN